MTQPARIVVVGSINTDMVVRAPHLPRPGETVLGGKFTMMPGGKGANQAVAAARLGGQVTFIARVGNDVFGDNALRGFEAEGIDTRWVVRDLDFPTGVALIGVDEGTGENSILVAPGANAALNIADIDRAAEIIQSAEVLVCQMEVHQDVIIAALELAHRAGVTAILNPAPAQSLPDYAWGYVSVLTPNRAELEAISDAPTLRQLGVGALAITLGAEGVLLVTDTGEQGVPARSVPRVVDTTAAGDCFTGALAVALGEGRLLPDAAAFANAAAALSVEKAGAQPSLPTRSEVDGFFQC